ncbi:hypothetical protein SteCoe_14109 [Stentor coeruleus]|uniref:Uncharacterized protein n=1 Tax=Stentor coeruleus TaxID=5963 RepID=A0A1R2C6V2_9CILI|nr:hypothetical protein SteCoe_14109 [Stentor coeruleus]
METIRIKFLLYIFRASFRIIFQRWKTLSKEKTFAYKFSRMKRLIQAPTPQIKTQNCPQQTKHRSISKTRVKIYNKAKRKKKDNSFTGFKKSNEVRKKSKDFDAQAQRWSYSGDRCKYISNDFQSFIKDDEEIAIVSSCVGKQGFLKLFKGFKT